jgi:hypothetical protein
VKGMLQNNHHFLFPQIFFGSFEDFDESSDLEDEEMEVEDSYTLLFDKNLPTRVHRKIGLYIDWTDDY